MTAPVAVSTPDWDMVQLGEPVGPDANAIVLPGVSDTVLPPVTTLIVPAVMLPRFALIAESCETLICAAVMVEAAI
jgi:hypothetical protein